MEKKTDPFSFSYERSLGEEPIVEETEAEVRPNKAKEIFPFRCVREQVAAVIFQLNKIIETELCASEDHSAVDKEVGHLLYKVAPAIRMAYDLFAMSNFMPEGFLENKLEEDSFVMTPTTGRPHHVVLLMVSSKLTKAIGNSANSLFCKFYSPEGYSSLSTEISTCVHLFDAYYLCKVPYFRHFLDEGHVEVSLYIHSPYEIQLTAPHVFYYLPSHSNPPIRSVPYSWNHLPLHFAVTISDIDQVVKLLNKNSDAMLCDEKGLQPMTLALYRGNKVLFSLLFLKCAKGYDANFLFRLLKCKIQLEAGLINPLQFQEAKQKLMQTYKIQETEKQEKAKSSFSQLRNSSFLANSFPTSTPSEQTFISGMHAENQFSKQNGLAQTNSASTNSSSNNQANYENLNHFENLQFSENLNMTSKRNSHDLTSLISAIASLDGNMIDFQNENETVNPQKLRDLERNGNMNSVQTQQSIQADFSSSMGNQNPIELQEQSNNNASNPYQGFLSNVKQEKTDSNEEEDLFGEKEEETKLSFSNETISEPKKRGRPKGSINKGDDSNKRKRKEKKKKPPLVVKDISTNFQAEYIVNVLFKHGRPRQLLETPGEKVRCWQGYDLVIEVCDAKTGKLAKEISKENGYEFNVKLCCYDIQQSTSGTFIECDPSNENFIQKFTPKANEQFQKYYAKEPKGILQEPLFFPNTRNKELGLNGGSINLTMRFWEKTKSKKVFRLRVDISKLHVFGYSPPFRCLHKRTTNKKMKEDEEE